MFACMGCTYMLLLAFFLGIHQLVQKINKANAIKQIANTHLLFFSKHAFPRALGGKSIVYKIYVSLLARVIFKNKQVHLARTAWVSYLLLLKFFSDLDFYAGHRLAVCVTRRFAPL